MVMKTPITKHTAIRISTFFDLVSPAPIWSPIGVIAMSAPRLKKAIPMTSITAEIMKTTISLAVRLISGVKFSTVTSKATGSTEISDSLSFP